MVTKHIIKLSCSEYHNKWVHYILDRYYKRYLVARELGYENEKSQKIACYKFGVKYFSLDKNEKPFTEYQMSTFKNFVKANNKTNRLVKIIDGENVLTDFKNLSKSTKQKYYQKFTERVNNSLEYINE